jgi:hypothetical protein
MDALKPEENIRSDPEKNALGISKDDLSYYHGSSRSLLRNTDQQDTPSLFCGTIPKVNKSISFTQSIKPNASPRSQRVTTDFIILDFEPRCRVT